MINVRSVSRLQDSNTRSYRHLQPMNPPVRGLPEEDEDKDIADIFLVTMFCGQANATRMRCSTLRLLSTERGNSNVTLFSSSFGY